MSALRNAVKRKTHKERAMPSARARMGLLEKHKDYVKRAQDYHRKEKHLTNLKQKAEFRNPDEFYFAMQKARTKDGVHINDGEASKYTQEELQLMKTQDMTYVQLKAQTDSKKAERLKSSLHFIGLEAQNKHTIFVDDAEQAWNFNAAEHFDTAPELVERTFNRPRRAQLEGSGLVAAGRGAHDPAALAEEIGSARAGAYKELQSRAARGGQMGKVAQAMALQKELMAKGGHKRKFKTANEDGGANEPVYRWKKERKK